MGKNHVHPKVIEDVYFAMLLLWPLALLELEDFFVVYFVGTGGVI